MMDLVSERVSAGVPDQEIVDELLGSYTGAVLLDPPASGATLVLWLAPLAVLGLGIAVILWWRRHPPSANAEEPATPGRNRTRLVVGGVVLVLAFAGNRRGRRQLTTGSAGLGRRGGSHRRAGLVRCEQRDHGGRNRRQRRRSTGQRDASRSGGALLRRGDYRSAFPHYLVVAEDPNASGDEAITALVRLGWMAYAGNGEVETATRLIDEALGHRPRIVGCPVRAGTSGLVRDRGYRAGDRDIRRPPRRSGPGRRDAGPDPDRSRSGPGGGECP